MGCLGSAHQAGHTAPSHPIPSHPIPSHPIPSHPIPLCPQALLQEEPAEHLDTELRQQAMSTIAAMRYCPSTALPAWRHWSQPGP